MNEERTEMERYKTSENKEDASLALTESEKQILRLRLVMRGAVSDYQIARLLRIDVSNVARSRKNALHKIERAQADLEFAQGVGAAK